MNTTFVFLADGFEEIEALTCIDVLRRAGMPVTTVSINPCLEVTGAHGVTVLADSLFGDSDYEGAEWLVLPGGIPGAPNLAACEPLCDLLTAQDERGGKVAAICASPAVGLAPLGLLQDRRAPLHRLPWRWSSSRWAARRLHRWLRACCWHCNACHYRVTRASALIKQEVYIWVQAVGYQPFEPLLLRLLTRPGHGAALGASGGVRDSPALFPGGPGPDARRARTGLCLRGGGSGGL